MIMSPTAQHLYGKKSFIKFAPAYRKQPGQAMKNTKHLLNRVHLDTVLDLDG
jgi:hypothetical protein